MRVQKNNFASRNEMVNVRLTDLTSSSSSFPPVFASSRPAEIFLSGHSDTLYISREAAELYRKAKSAR